MSPPRNNIVPKKLMLSQEKEMSSQNWIPQKVSDIELSNLKTSRTDWNRVCNASWLCRKSSDGEIGRETWDVREHVDWGNNRGGGRREGIDGQKISEWKREDNERERQREWWLREKRRKRWQTSVGRRTTERRATEQRRTEKGTTESGQQQKGRPQRGDDRRNEERLYLALTKQCKGSRILAVVYLHRGGER